MDKRRKIRGVIFDWNGTLSNDIPKIFNVSMKTARKLGGKPLSFAEYRKRVRNPYMLFYRELGCMGSLAETNRWYGHFLAKSRIHAGLFSDAVTVLKFLKAKDILVGIVSSHPESSILREARNYGIRKYLDFVKGDIHRKGGHIRMFLKRYTLKPREVIFVGDMVNDIEEGRKCGVITAAYLRGVDTRKKLLTVRPDIVLPALTALNKHVK